MLRSSLHVQSVHPLTTGNMRAISVSHFLRTVQTSETFELYSYNGTAIQKLKNNILYTTLSDNQPTALAFTLSVTDYENSLLDRAFVQGSIFAKVFKGENVYTGEYFSQVKRFDIQYPGLELSFSNVTKTSALVRVDFPNPLTVPLTNATLVLSGAHIRNQEFYIGQITNQLGWAGQIEIASWSLHRTCVVFATLLTDQISSFTGSVVIAQ